MNDTFKDHKTPHCPPRGLKVLRIIGMTIAGIALAVLLGFLFALVVKGLWNWLMPALFGLGKITYWQAFGLFILAKLLFGNFGHHHDKEHNDKVHAKARDRWHRWIGVEDKEWHPAGSQENWKYYKKFWEEEGKAAFEDYIKKQEAEKPGQEE